MSDKPAKTIQRYSWNDGMEFDDCGPWVSFTDHHVEILDSNDLNLAAEAALAEARQERDRQYEFNIGQIAKNAGLEQQVTQQAATISTLLEALQWMSDKRAFTIFIEEEAHVANFFEKCDAALASIHAKEKP